MTSFMFNRKSIYIAGGFNDESNSILRFDLPSCIWTDVAPLSNNRSKFGCVAIDKQIFMFGGKKGK